MSESINQTHLDWLEREQRMMDELVDGLVSLRCVPLLLSYRALTQRRCRQPMLSLGGFMRRGFATMSM